MRVRRDQGRDAGTANEHKAEDGPRDVVQVLVVAEGDPSAGIAWRQDRASRVRRITSWLEQVQSDGEPVTFNAMADIGQIAVLAPQHVIDGLARQSDVRSIVADEPTDVI